MKKAFTIYAVVIAFFFSSCASVCYKEPSSVQQKEVAVHNVNNIFN